MTCHRCGESKTIEKMFETICGNCKTVLYPFNANQLEDADWEFVLSKGARLIVRSLSGNL